MATLCSALLAHSRVHTASLPLADVSQEMDPQLQSLVICPRMRQRYGLSLLRWVINNNYEANLNGNRTPVSVVLLLLPNSDAGIRLAATELSPLSRCRTDALF